MADTMDTWDPSPGDEEAPSILNSSKLSASRAAFQMVLKQAYQLYCSESEEWLTEVQHLKQKAQMIQRNQTVISDKGRQYKQKCERLTEDNRKLLSEVEQLREKLKSPCSHCQVYEKQLQLNHGIYDKAYEALLKTKDEQIAKLEEENKRLKASRRKSRSRTDDTQSTLNSELSPSHSVPSQDTEYTEMSCRDAPAAPITAAKVPSSEDDCIVTSTSLQNVQKKQLKSVNFDDSATQGQLTEDQSENISPGTSKDKLKLTRSGKRLRSRYSEEQIPEPKKVRTNAVRGSKQFVAKTPSQELMRPPLMPVIETPEATDKDSNPPEVLVPETEVVGHDTLSDSDLQRNMTRGRFVNQTKQRHRMSTDSEMITCVPDTVPFDLDLEEEEEEVDEDEKTERENDDEKTAGKTAGNDLKNAARKDHTRNDISTGSESETSGSMLPTQIAAHPLLLHSPPSYASTPITTAIQGTVSKHKNMITSPIPVDDLDFDDNSEMPPKQDGDKDNGPLSITTIGTSSEDSDSSDQLSPVFKQRTNARPNSSNKLQQSSALFEESGDKIAQYENESPTADIIEMECDGSENIETRKEVKTKQRVVASHNVADVISPLHQSHKTLNDKSSESSPSMLSGRVLSVASKNKQPATSENSKRLSRQKTTKSVGQRASSRILRSQSSQENETVKSPPRPKGKIQSSPIGKVYITADSPGSKAKSKKLVQSKISADAFKSPRVGTANTSMTEQELKDYEEAVKRSLQDANTADAIRYSDGGHKMQELDDDESPTSTTKKPGSFHKNQSSEKVTSPVENKSSSGKQKRSTASIASRKGEAKENSPFKKPRTPVKPSTPKHRQNVEECVSPRRSPRLMRDRTNSPNSITNLDSPTNLDADSQVRGQPFKSRRSLQMDDTLDPNATTASVYTMALNGSIDPAANLSQYDSHPDIESRKKPVSQFPFGVPLDESITVCKEKSPKKSKLKQSKISSMRIQPERSQKLKSSSLDVVEDSGGGIDSSAASVVFGPSKKMAVVRADVHSMTTGSDERDGWDGAHVEDSEMVEEEEEDPEVTGDVTSYRTTDMMDDSFDLLPKKDAGPGHAYVDVVRKKAERLKLKAYTCSECEKYFSAIAISEEEKAERMKHCRHRARFLPPDTPEHFWSVGFPDTQECKEKGYLNTTQHKPSKFRRKKGFKALFNTDEESESKKKPKTHQKRPDKDVSREFERPNEKGGDMGTDNEDTSSILL